MHQAPYFIGPGSVDLGIQMFGQPDEYIPERFTGRVDIQSLQFGISARPPYHGYSLSKSCSAEITNVWRCVPTLARAFIVPTIIHH